MIADFNEDIVMEADKNSRRGMFVLDRTRAVIKRLFDLSAAILLLLAALPLMLVVSVLIRVNGGGPILFAHERIGKDGRTFACLKFRTMVRDADAVLHRLLATSQEARLEWDRTQKLRNDPRVLGAVGRFLRQTSLDELPQLLNVLWGDMSLVGPRPVVRSELRHYGTRLHWYLSTRPGLTGPWQVSGRSDTSYAARVALDVDYAMNPSLRRDLLILLRTPGAVLLGKGAC